MTNTQKEILNLIKVTLNPDDNQGSIIVEDYDELLQELSDQSIIGIPGEYIVKSESTPEDVKHKWTNIVYSQVAKWTKLMEEQTKLIKLLNENGIELAIIKGSAAAMNYPKPEYRMMGDVDFFVKEEDFEKAFDLLKENGYEYALDEAYGELHKNKEQYHHVELSKSDVVFELHKRMSDTIQGKETDEEIESLIMEGMDHIEMGCIGEYEFPMFEKKLNGLIILRHIIQHLGGSKGVGLRHILDWMMFVEKNVDDAYWNGEFAAYLEEVNLKDAAIVFARMAQIYFGMDESITWCKIDNKNESSLQDANDKAKAQAELDTLCEGWMEQIMASGNFGAKMTKEDEGASVLYKNKNLFTMLGSLQHLGLENWAPAREHKILRPFAWAYQVGRYARKGLGRKAPIKSLKQDMAKSKDKKELMAKLKI